MTLMPVTSPLLDSVRALISEGEPIYLVGGAVRDAVLGNSTRDLDFACHHGLKMARKVADGLSAAFYPLDENFDTARVIVQRPGEKRDILDFAGYRGDSLDADLHGRDFTINAIAMDLHTGKIIDPLGGVNDIREKRIRACSEEAFISDPIRSLRAIRQAVAFGFSITPGTGRLIRAAADLLPEISPERQRDELLKILEGPKPDTAFRALEVLGILPFLLPELTPLKGFEQSRPHVHDVWEHTLAVMNHLEGIFDVLAPRYDEQLANADLFNGLLSLLLGRYREQVSTHLGQILNTDRSTRSVLFFAALYHDVSKPQTRSVEADGRIRFLGHDDLGARTALKRAQALHLSNDEIERLQTIIKHHMRVHGLTSRKQAGKDVSRKAIYRFFRDTGESGIDLVLLALADTRATYEQTLSHEHWAAVLDVCRILLEAWYERADEIIRPRSLLNGDDLISELKLKPGPEIGRLLEAIRETQASGNLSSRDAALAFARGWLAKDKEFKSTGPTI